MTIDWDHFTWSEVVASEMEDECDICVEAQAPTPCSLAKYVAIFQPVNPEAAPYAATMCEVALAREPVIDDEPLVALIVLRAGLLAPNSTIYTQ